MQYYDICTFSNTAYGMYSPSPSTCTGTSPASHDGHLQPEETGLEDIIPPHHFLALAMVGVISRPYHATLKGSAELGGLATLAVTTTEC
jgi:hypothetical protein